MGFVRAAVAETAGGRAVARLVERGVGVVGVVGVGGFGVCEVGRLVRGLGMVVWGVGVGVGVFANGVWGLGLGLVLMIRILRIGILILHRGIRTLLRMSKIHRWASAGTPRPNLCSGRRMILNVCRIDLSATLTILKTDFSRAGRTRVWVTDGMKSLFLTGIIPMTRLFTFSARAVGIFTIGEKLDYIFTSWRETFSRIRIRT